MSLLRKTLLASTLGLVLGMGACKKPFLEREPSDQVMVDESFTDMNEARAAMKGINRAMYRYSTSDHASFGQKGIDMAMDVMGEDMPFSGTGAGWFVVDVMNFSDFNSGGGTASYMWSFYYGIINNANRVIKLIDDNTVGTQEEKDAVIAQALTYRAYSYLQLVQLFQHTYASHATALGVPIYLEPTREGKARDKVITVYTQIEKDLTDALDLYESSFDPRETISDINSSVAKGLLARMYLLQLNFPKAAEYAQAARADFNLMSAAQLTAGFNSANGEWIWGSVLNEEQSSTVVSFTSHMDFTADGYASLGSQKLINRDLHNRTLANNPEDVRYEWFYAEADAPFKRYSQKKFKVKNPGSSAIDLVYMRAAEMYLIEAEALTLNGNISQGADVLEELIQTRNPNFEAPRFDGTDPEVTELDVQIALAREIVMQRRLELWGEGFRLLDIKRYMVYGQTNNKIGGLEVFPDGELGVVRSLVTNNGVPTAYFRNILGLVQGFTNPLLKANIPGSEIEANPNMVRD